MIRRIRKSVDSRTFSLKSFETIHIQHLWLIWTSGDAFLRIASEWLNHWAKNDMIRADSFFPQIKGSKHSRSLKDFEGNLEKISYSSEEKRAPLFFVWRILKFTFKKTLKIWLIHWRISSPNSNYLFFFFDDVHVIEMIFISCVFFLFFAIIRFKTHINSGAKKNESKTLWQSQKKEREREMEMEMENGSEECVRQSFKMMDHTSHHYIGMKSNSILRSESIRKTHSTEQRYRKSNQDLTKI